MSIIPEFYLEATTSIGVLMENGEVFFIGTGFLVFKEIKEGSGYIFLITNKHVIENQRVLKIRFNSLDNTKSKDYDLELFDSENKPHFSAHPSPNIDIVAIYINTKLIKSESYSYSSFNLDTNALTLKEMIDTGVETGSFIYSLGFPMNLVEDIKNPIARFGTIARISIDSTLKTNNYLIDSAIFPGNSGGPVINRPESMSIINTPANSKSNLIGIVHSYIPYTEQLVSQQSSRIKMIMEENSKLAFVHPVDYIIDVVKIEWERMNLPKTDFNRKIKE